MASISSQIVRAIIGRNGSVKTPDTNVGLVNGIIRQLGISESDKGWAKKVADNIGVHPDTVRRWKRGQRPTLNKDLVKAYRRNNLKKGRETRLKSGDGLVIEATLIVSDEYVKQNMYLGRYAKSEMGGRDMTARMLDAYLNGDSPMAEFRSVLDHYLEGFGGTLDQIHRVEW